jgi:hypothetical protein
MLRDHIVVLANGLQGIAQLELPAGHHGQQPHLSRGQVLVARHELKAAVLHRDQRVGGGAVAEQHVATRVRQRVLLDAAAHRGVALRIEVDEQHTALRGRERGGEIHGSRGLANPAFLVRDGNDSLHLVLAFGLIADPRPAGESSTI